MKPDLEGSIRKWKQQLHHYQGLEPEYIDELEDHLRSSIEDKLQEGMYAQAAFEQAAEEVYDLSQLSNSYLSARLRREWMPLAIQRHLAFCVKFLKRNAGLTSLNLLGLSIGIAVFLLINTYTFHELRVDQFHEKKASVFRLGTQLFKNGDLDFSGSATYPGVGPDALVEIPEVINQCRLFQKYRPCTVRHGDKVFREEYFYYADSTFFELFSYPLIAGNLDQILREPNTVIVDEATARKYFGDEDPIGKRIEVESYDGEEHFEITGVFRSPHNSHLQFSFIGSFSSYVNIHGAEGNTQWSWLDFYTYVELPENADLASFEQKLPDFIDRHIGERLGNTAMQFNLQRLDEIYLTSDNLHEPGPVGNSRLLQLLTSVGFVILFIAWINYVNLYSAHAIQRAKEIGLRKVLGSSKGQLWQQFMTESVFINGVAVLLGLVIFTLSVPWFNEMSSVLIDMQMLSDPIMILMVLSVWLLGSIITGFYPAQVLSSFQPIPAIKGLIRQTGKGASLRKLLIVSQFVMGVVFIAATLIVRQQMLYLENRGLGIATENMLVIRAPDLIADGAIHESKMMALRDQLMNGVEITSASAASELPGKAISWWGGTLRLGAPKEERVTLFRMSIDEHYLPMYQAPFLAGRNFGARPAPNHVIINELAARELGLGSAKEAMNKKVLLARDTFTIQGVVANFHQENFKAEIQPAIFHYNAPLDMKFLVVNANSPLGKEKLTQIEDQYATFFPGSICSWFFVDDYLTDQNESESTFFSTLTLFSALAILIALLGLVGLTSFYTHQRSKEISIKKLLGSSLKDLYWGLTKDIVKYILLANFLALPLILWFARYWLDQFAYHISFNWLIPIVTLCITLAISLLTISRQILKVALTNPLHRLRYE